MRRIVLDCDPGLDDVIALMLALCSPELSVEAVTVVAGNRPVARCLQNALKITEHYHRTEVPVYQGADRPLCRILPTDDVYSGRDGMAEVFLPYNGTQPAEGYAPDVIVQLARRYHGELWLVSTGPMTNIALALQQEPRLPELLAGLVTINGCYGVARDGERIVSRAGWNILVDPEAASQVLESGINIHALGVDVTGQLTDDIWQQLLQGSTQGGMPHHLLQSSATFLQGRGLSMGGMFVDAMAIAWLLDPTIADFVEGKVLVELSGEHTVGMTIFDNVGNIRNQSRLRAARSFDFAKLTTMLSQRIFL